MIYIENLSKIYDNNVTAVQDMNLDIPTGEIFGLLGPNGAGKTTTIRLLSCILKPTKGDAVVADFSVRHDQEQIRSNIGLLSETPSLYERLSTRKNLEIIGRLYGLTREQATKRSKELAKLFAFDEYLEREAGTLSKGNKHKVAIARSLIHNPKVIFLDEPTASLDPEMAKVVRETIETLTASLEVTVLICTHNLYEAERLCSRVGIINKGSVIAVGSTDELIAQKYPEHEIYLRLRVISDHFSALLEDNQNITSVRPINDDGYLFYLEKPEKHLPTVVKNIVEAGGEVLALYEKKKSLEDVYFDYLDKEAI